MVKILEPWISDKPEKNGKYRMRTKFINPMTGKYSTVSTTIKKHTVYAIRKGKEELQKKADKKANDLEQGHGLKQKRVTLGNLKDNYLKWLKPRSNSYNSYIAADYQLNVFVKDIGQNILVTRINTIYLNKYFNDFITNHSNSTVTVRKAMVKDMFDYAVMFGILQINPVINVKVRYKNEDTKRAKRKENMFLTDEEYQKILKYCDEQNRQDYKDLFTWLYNSGMRVSEACALYPTDIFKKGNNYYCKVTGSLEQRRHVSQDERLVKNTSAKTFKGNRNVLMNKAMIDIYNRNKNNVSNVPLSGNTKILFVNQKRKHPFIRATIALFLRKAAKAKKINKKLESHMFRHTHISKLTEKHIPLNVIMDRVGHSDAKTTIDIYSHVTEKETIQLKEVLKDF